MAITYGASTAATTTYQSLVIAVCAGLVYIGYSFPSNTFIEVGGQSVPLLTPDVPVSMAYINNHVYIVDGTNTVDVNLTTNTAVAMTASVGTLPAGCTLAASWRGRLMLAGQQGSPQIVYASRVSVPNDFNFGATDVAAAFADNPASSGKIGEPVLALIPYSDDYFIVGCSHSMFMYQGDPAAGGTNVTVSQNMGVVGKDAWTVDPAGTLYYIATGGLFSVKPIWEYYRPPENLTKNAYNQFFQNLNPGTQYIKLLWDADLHYLHMFVTPVDNTQQNTHLIFDERNGGLWPQQFPLNIGPTTALLYLSDNDPNQRGIFLGGWDGYVRRFAFVNPAGDDDGTAITSSITLGPIAPFPEAALLTGLTIDLGEFPPGAYPTPSDTLFIDDFTGDGSTQVFDFSQTIDLSVDSISVTVSGVTLTNGVDYTYGDADVAFTVAPALNAPIVVTVTTTGSTAITVATATVKSGPDAYGVTEGTPHSMYAVGMYLGQRQKVYRQRLRGRWFTVTIGNTTDALSFSFESAMMEFDQAGRQRSIR